jgi:hypothetical protein
VHVVVVFVALDILHFYFNAFPFHSEDLKFEDEENWRELSK